MSAGKHPRYRGWPRQKVAASFSLASDTRSNTTIKMLPNLWIGGTAQLEGDWLTFQRGRERQAYTKRLCVVCGEVCKGTLVLGHMGRGKHPEAYERVTDGPGGHPRCIWLAVNTCPHFQRGYYADKDDNTHVAFRYDGEGAGFEHEGRYFETLTSEATVHRDAVALTLSELRVLAKERPLG